MKNLIFGGIEGGGTKFVCAVGRAEGESLAETRFPTTTPEETLGRAAAFFQEQIRTLGPLAGLGIACFGPLDPNPDSPSYGRILATPKAGWAGADVVGTMRSALSVPIAFDTDVNGAALGEWRWGAAQGLSTFLYFTIGTGVGGGAMVEGKLLHGLIHPEMGHIPLPHDYAQDPFPGSCPFHGDCFEGLASGPALEKRWGQRAETLPPDHPAWELEAHYIALAMQGFICSFSPQRIILGGGVPQQPSLLPLVRAKTLKYLNNYVGAEAINKHMDTYIVPPGLGSRAGVCGAFALAQQAASGAGV
ncbi:MAG TPA: ROK family protein [Anaerolineaceae bacterium]|mgnify:FL=1|nr:ROK family protein [Anaerolineaceae bacterium]HOE34154.1 ROK family protein [Anaerolineaceae bacterium]HOT25151.1 ROK family protein [Anaerolineaceae bacterium]HQH57917.1 ROK family protein [Anaerolineaceae bacterium]HQK02788.1 ROK family protein [Anaerolineaceae bacterium]